MTPEPVGDFYVHLMRGPEATTELTSSTKLLSTTGKPSVIHFYDGGWGGCRPCAAQMELWAKAYPNVQFICVCVESKGVASMFYSMFRFERAVNCYIPDRRYFPVGYGQLGCSGFIVVDGKGCFVSRKTRAYLQYGDAAFSHVEKLLSQQLKLPMYNTAPTRQKIQNVEQLSSVGVHSMDKEHEACAESLSQLVKSLSMEALKRVLDDLVHHFDHEEKLMQQYGFGQGGGGGATNATFSPFASHAKDHQRILDIARNEIERLSLEMSAAFKKSCCQTSWHPAPPVRSNVKKEPEVTLSVDSRVAKEIVEAFHVHAQRFDALYENVIPSTAD